MKTKLTLLGALLGVMLSVTLVRAQLLIDFGPTGSNPLEPGFQGYSATTTQPATFVTQSYSVFGTNVTITPVWDVATAGAIRMINRANAQTENNSLLRDWLGTDNRTTSGIIPVTLSISNLPAGTYRWLSYHHDPADQTGLFDASVADAKGSRTNFNIDISNGNLPLASVTKWITTITSDGTPVRLRFRGTATTPTASSFFVMNGFELSFLGIASEWAATGGGNWSSAANWDANGVPNSATALALFGSSILAPSTVTVDTPITVTSLGINSLQSYTIAGANTLTLSGSSGITVDAGSHTISTPIAVTSGGGLTISGAGELALLGNNTYTGPTVATVPTLTIASLANGGSPSSVGASASDAANLTFAGTLRYIGSGHTSDRLFTLGTGTRTLEASGTGALVLNNSGGLSLSGTGARTLVLSGTNTGNNTLNAVLMDDAAFNKTSLTKNGPGKWVIGGGNSSTGNINVNEGTLALGASGTLGTPLLITVRSNAVLDASAPGGLTLGFGQQLAGAGSIVGNFADGGSTINPGGSNVAATLTFSNNLNVTGGGTLLMDLGSSTTVGGGVNDLIQVNGDLDLSSAIVRINFTGTTLSGSYRLINYTGNLVGTPNVMVQGLENTPYNAVISTATGGQVNLVVTGNPASLIWRGDIGGNTWDINGTFNWTNPAIAALDQYNDLDNVTFSDAGNTASNVNLSTVLHPGSVTVNSSGSYIFSGTGRLSGAMGLTKAGSGSLVISNFNDYTGTTTVSGGVVQMGTNNALGSHGDVVIQSGGTVDVNGNTTGTNHFYVAGNGAGGAGAVVNTRADQLNAIRHMTLTGDARVASDFRWDVRGSDGNGTFSGIFDLGGFTFTRVGSNRIAIVDCFATNAGNIVMVQGGMSLTRSIISGPGYIDVGTNFVWIENSTTGSISKPLIFSGGTLQCSGGDFVLDSFITNTAGLIIDAGNILTISNRISGVGSLTKIGTGTALLESANTYAGDTTINAGTLRLGTNGTIGAGSAINLASGATLDALAIGGLTVASGKTFNAGGTVNGALAINNGATLQIGTATNIGALTIVNGNATLAGATLMKLNAAAKTTDVITTTNSIALGGTLTVSVLTGTLAPGDTYKLFNAPVLNNNFSTVSLPPPGPNNVWVNKLAVDGTISVVQLKLTMAAIPGGFLQFTWDPALNGLVKLQAQTNSLNVGISTNWGNYPGGTFNGTVVIPDPNSPSVFFRLSLQ